MARDKAWRKANRKYKAWDARNWQKLYWELRRKAKGKVELARGNVSMSGNQKTE
jgi:hypothetical protein